jgi:hypothetical protein
MAMMIAWQSHGIAELDYAIVQHWEGAGTSQGLVGGRIVYWQGGKRTKLNELRGTKRCLFTTARFGLREHHYDWLLLV